MKQILTFVLLAAALIGGFSDAHARQWKATKAQKTLEYLQIKYQKADNTIVFLQWIAPAMFEDTAALGPARDMTSKYVIVLLAHAKVNQMGEWLFADPKNIVVETVDRNFRRPLSEEEMPPAVFGLVAAISKVIAQGLGPLGKKMVAKVFSSDGISVCGEGGFWVNYAGERYDYKTPIPGCEDSAPSNKQSLR